MHLSNTTLISPIQGVIHQLDQLRELGSFGSEFYPLIDKMIDEIAQLKFEGVITNNDINFINNYYGKDFLDNTLNGMALTKPFGYSGDFMMIDKMYTSTYPIDPFYKSWDKYFQNHAGPRAVRNRKAYFKNIIHQKLETTNSMILLNVASGPARDLQELYDELKGNKILKTTCVEMDKHAVTYAQKIVKKHINNIEFITKNIFRHHTEKKYDVIWSAGLFDYFDDKAFVIILKKFKQWIANGGEIIIGNFNEDHNPTRNYMELFGDWHLIHRTENQLIKLAIEAGFNKDQLSVGREEQNVNLFLHIKNN